jgi:hypothetical protein
VHRESGQTAASGTAEIIDKKWNLVAWEHQR